ncbi:PLP-dependent aminotransferase family protein [Paenibacillus sp. CN-4]|uniref:aminotransferase-like domain-containing protein n=1 Tax=Paenibacillus nanchangensis TaxID=3348343 RepID=UPI00397A570F
MFRQICGHIRNRIARGEWAAHDRLPSVRALAAEIGVHRLTVFKAYQILKDEGAVYVKDKSGYYVAASSAAEQAPKQDPKQDESAGASPYALSNRLSEIQRTPAEYQFSQALIDPNLLPNLYLSEYVKKVFDLYPKVMGTYADVQGDAELRTMLTDSFKRSAGLQLSPEEVMITSGAQQAINLLAGLFVGPLDTVLIERPTYSAALEIFKREGARLLPVDITPEGYDLERVEELMRLHRPRVFYMNPTHHNPTGFTVPTGQRKALVELAERYRCLLIEDDPFREMYFAEPPPPPLFAYDTEGWVVYIGSFSKYVAPGLRICAVACREPVMSRLITAKSLADNGTPLLNQKIFLHYYTSPRLQQHLGKLRIALQIRKETVEEALEGTDWAWQSPLGGLNLWVKLPPDIGAEALFAACGGQSVSFVPGSVCDPLGKASPRIRLCYSFMNEIRLKEGIRRLRAAADQLRTGQAKGG